MHLRISQKVLIVFSLLLSFSFIQGLLLYSALKQFHTFSRDSELPKNLKVEIHALEYLKTQASIPTYDSNARTAFDSRFRKTKDILARLTELSPRVLEGLEGRIRAAEAYLNNYRKAFYEMDNLLEKAQALDSESSRLFSGLRDNLPAVEPDLAKKFLLVYMNHYTIESASSSAHDITILPHLKEFQKEMAQSAIDPVDLLAVIQKAIGITEAKYINSLAIEDRRTYLAESAIHLTEFCDKLAASITESIEQYEINLKRIMSLLLASALVLTMVLFWMTRIYFKKFLRSQQTAIAAIKNGRYDYPVTDLPRDELGDLALFMKNMANSLQKNEEELRRYEKIVSSSSDMMALLDKQYRFIAANRAYCAAFNLTHGQLIGKKAPEVLGNNFFNTYLKSHADHCLTGREVNFQNWTDFPQRGRRFMDVNYYPYFNRHNEIMGYVVSGRDITERKQAEMESEKLEEQLRQSQKMEALGTFAGGIAHDFNNMLAIIMGNAEMATDDIPEDNPARESIREIHNASKRAKDLVSQILDFSRKEKKELMSIEPQILINETLKLLRSVTPTTVSIIQNISKDCGSIQADPTGLHQLLMNLFTNAVQAVDEKGEVIVGLEEIDLTLEDFDQMQHIVSSSMMIPGKYARLSITDNGSGIDEKTVSRIFDPFFTTKDTGKGTGMGLAVVHGIVENHGGYITVESEPGRGSTFNVFLPIAYKIEEHHEVEKDAPPSGGTESLLLVDDEEGLLRLASHILKRLGYRVTAEISSLKALETFRIKPDQFDLIITDQAMPDMSGTELIAEILKIRTDIPCILCTGYSSKVNKENAGEKGISKFLNKPFNRKTLASAVRKVLDERLLR